MKQLNCLFFLAIGLLAACNQVHEPATLEPLALTLADIQWLAIDPNTEKRLEGLNCAANELNLPGQGFKSSGVGGADGGMTYDSSLTTNTGVTQALNIGNKWPNITSFVGEARRDATLLVVDDFRGDEQGNNAVYTPLPAIFLQPNLDIATLQALQANNQLSHGAMVYKHAEDVIQGTGLYPFRAVPSQDVTVFRTTRGINANTRFLTVKAINTRFENTGVIAGSIKSQKIVQKLDTALRGATGGPLPGTIIVNLSFVLIPCEAYADYTAFDNANPGDTSFREYLERLASFNNVAFADLEFAIVEGANNPADPLYQLLQGAVGVKKNIFVAASGNYGFKTTAMYPAKWPGVINVSGSAANKQSVRYDGFNTGEIMDIGVSLRVRASRFTTNPAAKDVFIMGTSFSVPSVAAYSAIDVAGQERCINTGTGVKSKLAINSANLLDTRLVRAVKVLCP